MAYPPLYSRLFWPSSQSTFVQNQNTLGIGGTLTPSCSRLISCLHLGQTDKTDMLVSDADVTSWLPVLEEICSLNSSPNHIMTPHGEGRRGLRFASLLTILGELAGTSFFGGLTCHLVGLWNMDGEASSLCWPVWISGRSRTT